MSHPKEGKAIYRYDHKLKDFVFAWGDGARAGAAWLHYFATTKHMHYNLGTDEWPTPIIFEPSMVEQLEAAGYDTKTLKITIQKKHDAK